MGDDGSTASDIGRPRMRWHHAHTLLDDFAIITWAVDPARLRPHVPDGFEIDRRDGMALVSMVPFRDRDFRFRGLPRPRLSCGQVNYRTYVRHGDRTGVWFFGTSLDSRLVSLPRALWRMPWQRTPVAISAAWRDGPGTTWSMQAGPGWGTAEVRLTGTGAPLGSQPGFADHAEEQRVLFDPTRGWYERLGGGVGRYSVWHAPLALEAAEICVARCDVFVELGLIEPGEPPQWAGIQRSVHFDVHTPPRKGP